MCVRAKSLRRAEGKRESMKPVIGIIAACTREVHPAYTTGHDYVRAVERAGGLALLLPATPDAVSAGMAQWLALCGGFVLPGGGDVAPTYYGQSPVPQLTSTDRLRDNVELTLCRAAAQHKKPLLGICLGMQLLFEKSYEYGEHEGLGFVKGEVCPLEPDLADKSLKVPQIGWNALHIVKDDPLFKYIREGEYVYYVHSYYGKNCTESTLAVSDYSIPVTGAVRAGRVYGTQFHPEKSGDTGLRILKAFSEL